MSKALQKLDAKELEVLLKALEKDTCLAGHALFPDQPPGYEAVLEAINQWAINRKIVLESRANGNAHIAHIFDKICYRIWQQLPSYARKIELHAV